MSDKTKRRLAIADAAVICIALVVAIGMRFAKEPVRPDASSQEPVSSSEVANRWRFLPHYAKDRYFPIRRL